MDQKRSRLTDSIPAWELAYVENKVNPPKQTLPQRTFGTIANIVDDWTHPRRLATTAELLACVKLLADVDRLGKTATVTGCGPQPATVRELADCGFRVTGVEPVPAGVEAAREYIAGMAEIMPGTAEKMTLADSSQALVLMENVLEHVDSVNASLTEAYRVLKPGGVLFVRTTNRHRFSFFGINWEFKTRFYNWFPKLVKESYVYDQLHYRPELAYYSSRPAVHWFSFEELCEKGREAGFARFYSPYDLMYQADNAQRPSRFFRLQHWLHRNPWLRAVVVSQMVGDIFMWKRQ